MYNAIIGALARTDHYEQVFAIYRLMLSGGPEVYPDAHTFGSLFRIVNFFSRPRTLRSRKHKIPPNAPTARELFREMTRLHGLHTKAKPSGASIVMTASILNKALNTFMKRDDYAAACVVLRAFRMCNLAATTDTYRIVVCELLRRLHANLSHSKHSTYPTWASRFLGGTAAPRVEMDVRLLDSILRLGLDARLSLKPLPSPSVADNNLLEQVLDRPVDQPITPTRKNWSLFEITEGSNRIPTPLVVLGILEPAFDSWTTIPLERIIRRAILATFARIFLAPIIAVSSALKDAKADMIYPAYCIRSELKDIAQGSKDAAKQETRCTLRTLTQRLSNGLSHMGRVSRRRHGFEMDPANAIKETRGWR